MAEKERAFLLFFGKAKQNVCDHFAHSVFAFGEVSKGGRWPSFGRKNPKKPAVSWQGIQRGQRPLGTRLCSQSLVCYTFAKGRRAGGGFLLCREAKRITAVCAALA